MSTAKPKFGRFVTWGACSRCGARVRYDTLARERLTGLLVCTAASGRPVSPCLDPWPPFYDFQVLPDRSIEPPAEPLPARWGLDSISSASTYHDVSAGTTAAYAQAPKFAPDDATRLAALLKPPVGMNNPGRANFDGYRAQLNQQQNVASVTTVTPADYDGTFVPSNSVRTVTPPNPLDELRAVQNDPNTGDPLLAPPWAAQKGI